jgi:Ala-tRNA(Pro) deacylase
MITEEEMAESFKEYEVGAVPPLGELFGVPVYVDERLLDHERIIFSGGTHKGSIKMDCKDFIKLNKPQIVDIVEET